MLESMLNAMTHPFYVVDATNRSLVLANPAARKYAEQYPDLKCYALIHKHDQPCGDDVSQCPLEIIKKTKKSTMVEHVHHDQDGKAHHVEVYAYPIFDENKNVVQMIEYCLDVTERKLAEQEVESLAKFPSEDPNPVLRITEDGTVLYANAPGAAMLKQWNCRAGEHAPEGWHQYVSRILSTGKSEILEVTSGQRVFSLTIAPVIDAGYVNLYGMDITERKQAEVQLRQYRANLEKLVRERTEDLTEANIRLREEVQQRKNLEREILNISEQEQRRIGQELHDSLGQQLTGISFMTRVLEQKLAEKMPDAAARLAEISRLVNEAGAQARGLAKGLHPVDLNSGSLLSSLNELAESTQKLFGIKCSFRNEPGVIIEESETAVHLYRIAQEAVTNSIKHGRARNIEISLVQSSEMTTLTIENDGKDFPQENQSRGAGMGLHIMDHRVNLIGGSLEIRKGHKGGAIVSCTFGAKESQKE